MTLTIDISLPPVGCAQNSRLHHHAANRAVQSHRQEARDAALVVLRRAGLGSPAFRSVTVTATWYLAPKARDGRYRPKDGTNAQGALKAALDGLTDAGLVFDDDDKSVGQNRPIMLRTPQEHGGRAGVSLRIEGVGAGEITQAERDAWRLRQEAKLLREAGIRQPKKKGGKKAAKTGLFAPGEIMPRGGQGG